jgi:hypothetical protein
MFAIDKQKTLQKENNYSLLFDTYAIIMQLYS